MLLAKFSDIPEYKISQTYTTVVLSVWLKYAPIYGLNYIAKKKKKLYVWAHQETNVQASAQILAHHYTVSIMVCLLSEFHLITTQVLEVLLEYIVPLSIVLCTQFSDMICSHIISLLMAWQQ